jgi:D-alanine-D-alanine ligase
MPNDIKMDAHRMSSQDIYLKIDRHIEVVTTDTTGMKETAFGSIETCRSVFNVLKRSYAEVRFNEVQSVQDLQRIVDRDPDLVVLCVKYVAGKDTGSKIWLSEYFSQHDVPYTGSNRATLEFDSNKSKAKNALLDKKVATAKFFLAHPGLFTSEGKLPLPLPVFVKPLDAANGNGIDENSLVHDFASYKAKVEEIFIAYGDAALVEEVLPGREYTVVILDDPAHDCRMILPVEIVVPKNVKGDRVLGCREKSSNNETLSTVAEPALAAVSALAKEVFSVLGGRDFGRIDIKMDAVGNPHFIEANLVPGMTPRTSYFPRACNMNRCMSYESVVLKIVEAALSRYERCGSILPDEAQGALLMPRLLEVAGVSFFPTATADRLHVGGYHGQGTEAQQSGNPKAKEKEGIRDGSRRVGQKHFSFDRNSE